ncbi:MAG: shikimate dehydrogenase [Lachnospiraceae bacterium]|nr:shikimate dehydrogenase [Lachnospiraceae bacterium]
MIDGKTRTCCVFGNPVEHTKSPAIHNYLAGLKQINLAYIPCRIEQGRIEEAVKGAYALNLLGVNVTVPYKSDVIPYLVDIDLLAEQIGAVNTLVRREGGYKGYNTDMPGLYRAMVSDGVCVEGESVILLGAGGVARAVAVMLAEKGVGEILILNRTKERAQAIAQEVNDFTGKQLATAYELSEIHHLPEKKYLAIQCTSVGMHPNVDQAVVEDEAFYRRIHTGYDLVFNPMDTQFMRLVRAGGGRAFGGLKMLIYQGIIAFELWTDTQVSEEEAGLIYEHLMELEQQKKECDNR